MKSPVLLFLILSTPFTQVRAQAILSGTVQDGVGSSMPFASIALVNIRDSSISKSTSSDEQGLYSFQNQQLKNE
ncbi:hypothetical protein CWM47_02550 [Spirosoma pollinicola]|uniref:Carboxypeptidase regulatory-like domain-containing protein n=1 Tax=Spirosoma pollinicola TaxID=2057025 RepID=A0A2K8YT34_9BACT|nr:hypothetical protein CWM47_02550 [Spirosoma pollinicola]